MKESKYCNLGGGLQTIQKWKEGCLFKQDLFSKYLTRGGINLGYTGDSCG